MTSIKKDSNTGKYYFVLDEREINSAEGDLKQKKKLRQQRKNFRCKSVKVSRTVFKRKEN
ncbi:hypothetical protein P9738_10390 [Bacillus siamensis]|nr:hypothetical protein [Bacillus siamensis]MED5096632.1 hypothetical protein [Bacillus siamensis]